MENMLNDILANGEVRVETVAAEDGEDEGDKDME